MLLCKILLTLAASLQIFRWKHVVYFEWKDVPWPIDEHMDRFKNAQGVFGHDMVIDNVEQETTR